MLRQLPEWCDLHPRGTVLVLGAVAFLIAAPSLWTGFCTDDQMMRLVYGGSDALDGLRPGPLDLFAFSGRTAEETRQIKELGLVPWWTGDEWKIAFARPLSAITHWLDWQVFGPRPFPMHVVNLLWYAVLVMSALLLYRRFMPAVWMAAMAAFLYAIDAAHGMPAGWLSNRNAVIAAVLGVLAMVCYDRYRRDGWRAGYLLSIVLVSLSLLAGESGIATGGYLAAYALFIERGAWAARFVRLLPFALVVVAWRVAYSAAGYGSEDSALYVDPGDDLIGFAVRIVAHLPVLMFGQFGLGEIIAWSYLPGVSKWVAWGLMVGFLALIVFVSWPVLKRDAHARFWLAGAVLSTVPSCAALPQARLLVFTGIGGMAFMATVITHYWENPTSSAGHSPSLNPGLRALVGLWLVLHVGVSLVAMPVASCSMYFVELAVLEEMRTAPDGPGVEESTIIVMNGAADVWAPMFFATRISQEKPMPKYIRQLTAGVRTLTLNRVDERTMLLSTDGPLVGTAWTPAFRDVSKHPLHEGEKTVLPGLTVTVDQLGPDGNTQLRLEFDRALEDSSLRWLRYEGSAAAPFSPPAIGATSQIVTPSIVEMAIRRLGW